MRHLPPLNALRVFEAAARTGSYADTARELGVTPGAISRQMAILEAWFGQRLFTRIGRRMVPTPMAGILAAEVGYSFDRLATAAATFGRSPIRRILRVNAPTSFAMRWLIPRLGGFHAVHPSVEVVVTTVSTALEDLRGGFDVAIRRGVAHEDAWPRHRATPVLDDVDTLIMSPALFAAKPVNEAADVEGHVWLASETRAGDWSDWVQAARVPHLDAHPRRVFDHFFVTRQAVEDGLGIGIGPLPMLTGDIEDGKLVTPLPDVRVPRTGYVAIVPRHVPSDDVVVAFVEWLVGISR